MVMPPVHFAAGMLASLVIGAVLLLVRRRLLLYFPVLMTLCGLLALVPEPLAWMRGSYVASPLMDLFFFHSTIRLQPWLQTPEAAHAAFHLVAGVYLVCAVAYAVYIQRSLRRVPFATEALAWLGQKVQGYRALSVLVALAPLFVLGGGAVWLAGTERSRAQGRDAAAAAGERAWARLVQRRLRVDPGEALGLAHALPWVEGEWLAGDLAAHVPRGGDVSVGDIAKQAKSYGLDFVAIMEDTSASPEERAARADELRQVRQRHRGLVIFRGLEWGAPAGARGGTGGVLLAPLAAEDAVLDGVASRLDRLDAGRAPALPDAALRWLNGGRARWLAPPVLFAAPPDAGGAWDGVFALSRRTELCVGLLGIRECRRSEAASRWDPRVARLSGAWDQLLDRGIRLWGATAASGFRDPKTHFWPGERARTHVWCPGRRPADILAGLRAGCLWAEEGGIVRTLNLELTAPHLKRPARMGEVALVPPGADIGIVLTLDVPKTDSAGRDIEALDEVEFISNAAGEPAVVKTFTRVWGRRQLHHTLSSVADHNGGVGFYVRARGRRRLGDGSEQLFHTNPIRVLVRDLPEPRPLEDPRQLARKGPAQRHVRPRTGKADEEPADRERELRRALAAIGLPRDVPVLQIETFRKRPGRHWRGTWREYAEFRGPAMSDDMLTIRFERKTQIADDARLFFQCYSVDCRDLTILLHTSLSREPYRLVRVVPDRKWTEVDLSLTEDFFAPEGAPARIPEPAEVNAIEWRAGGHPARARFTITDFAIYRPTLSRRRDVFRRRLDELGAAIRENRRDSLPSPQWQERLTALMARAGRLRTQTDPAREPPAPDVLGALERELDDLVGRCRRLRLGARMGRAFLLRAPQFVVGLESATRRVSARNPAHAFRGGIVPAVELRAAAGEAESFQLVVIPLWDRLGAVEVTWSDLKLEQTGGDVRGAYALQARFITARLIDEVETPARADLPPQRTGWTPDPLLPFAPFDVEPGSLQAVLLTVRVPPDLPPGDYRGTITVRPRGLEPVQMALKLRRWDFALVGSRFSVLGAVEPITGVAEAKQPAMRRELYELLLDHRVGPIPVLGRSDAADLHDVTFCIERGLRLVVLHQAGPRVPTERDAQLARAARLAERIWQAGHGRLGAVLLRFAAQGRARTRAAEAISALTRRFPRLVFVTSGEGEMPARLRTDYWLAPWGAEGAQPPLDDVAAVRRSRTARRVAWHIRPGMPHYPHANATRVNRLVETRLIPWFAWQHGVRALVLPGVNSQEHAATGDGSLVYLGAQGVAQASLRLVALRDGIEDCEMLWLLWDRARLLRQRARGRVIGLLAAADAVANQLGRTIGRLDRPSNDPAALAALRLRIGRTVERLEGAWWKEVDREAISGLPGPPPQLKASSGNRQVELTWTRSPDRKVAAYHVYRSTHPTRGFARVNQGPITAPQFLDRSVANGVRYYYFVRAARDPKFEGPRSKVVRATPFSSR